VTNLTIVIFIVVIIAALLFAAYDGVFGWAYQAFYDAMQ
jgi:preprotein translocase subunit SecE